MFCPNEREFADGLLLGLLIPGGFAAWVFAMVGAVAQLGEHLLCKQGVSGSIPLSSTNCIWCRVDRISFEEINVLHRPYGWMPVLHTL
jgi:hypothetical protein